MLPFRIPFQQIKSNYFAWIL